MRESVVGGRGKESSEEGSGQVCGLRTCSESSHLTEIKCAELVPGGAPRSGRLVVAMRDGRRVRRRELTRITGPISDLRAPHVGATVVLGLCTGLPDMH